MKLEGKKVLVTGGAGFVGSHVVDRLVSQGCKVAVVDNLSTGNKKNIEHLIKAGKITFQKADLLNLSKLKKIMQGQDFVFHLAANADIRGGTKKTNTDLEQNTVATYNVLEAMRLNNVKKIVFFSSSAVYGEPHVFPTPESYIPVQTSLYGASKLAGEALIQAYCNLFDFQAWIFRSVSIIGERYSHGAVYDFVKKLKKRKDELEVLGNGEQKKSFLYVKDCVNGIFTAVEDSDDKINTFNLGTEEYITVKQLATIVTSQMKLEKVYLRYTGGIRGWPGDQPMVYLSIEKLRRLGWRQSVKTQDAVRKTVDWLLQNEWIFKNRK